jgi:fumarylacetoacetase
MPQSSIVVSGTEIHRPVGQILPQPGATQPIIAPCKRLDYELEVGFVSLMNGLCLTHELTD